MDYFYEIRLSFNKLSLNLSGLFFNFRWFFLPVLESFGEIGFGFGFFGHEEGAVGEARAGVEELASTAGFSLDDISEFVSLREISRSETIGTFESGFI